MARHRPAGFAKALAGEILASMPGIGPRTGARILAEIGDGSAFASGAKLAAYAGLAPVTRQSGTSLNAETRSRRGNHRLKNAMFLAAFAALRDPASKAFYDRKGRPFVLPAGTCRRHHREAEPSSP
jgi:transposase